MNKQSPENMTSIESQPKNKLKFLLKNINNSFTCKIAIKRLIMKIKIILCFSFGKIFIEIFFEWSENERWQRFIGLRIENKKNRYDL